MVEVVVGPVVDAMPCAGRPYQVLRFYGNSAVTPAPWLWLK